MKCVSCGGTNLVEGTVPLTAKDELKFNSTRRSFSERLFISGRKRRAYGCLHYHAVGDTSKTQKIFCGSFAVDHALVSERSTIKINLQFAVDFEPGDSERYQDFDGEESAVLERLEDGAIDSMITDGKTCSRAKGDWR